MQINCKLKNAEVLLPFMSCTAGYYWVFSQGNFTRNTWVIFNWHTCRYVYMYIYACMQIYCNCNCKQRICNSLCNTCNMHELHERYERHTLYGAGRSQTAISLTHLQVLYRERTFHGTERWEYSGIYFYTVVLQYTKLPIVQYYKIYTFTISHIYTYM